MLNYSSATRWDKEADVVVVGYGAAGAAAAITAHDAGARVLIIEKAPRGEEGGNSRVSGQGWLNPEPLEQAITHLNALCGAYTVPQEMVRTWAEEMAQNSDWVRDMLGGNPAPYKTGREGADFPDLPGVEGVRAFHNFEGTGERGFERLWKLLKAAVEKRQIETFHATPVKELVQHGDTKEILGVVAEREGKPYYVKARRAVVLTCGGFENNQEMIRDFLHDLPYCYPLGTPYNTGDGIKMALEVGADLWHMNNIAGPWYSLKVPEFPSILELMPLNFAKEFPGGMIVVGPDGKRFMDEKHRNTHGKVNISGQWTQAPSPCPMYMIFDHTLFSAGPLYDKHLHHGWNQILKLYDWSDDNAAEVAKGWIKKAGNLAELAKKVSLDSAALATTIARWNSICTAGQDNDFGRTRMLSPIVEAPFYAIELSPVFINTQGGPRRDSRARIVRPNRTPIMRLYSAGELGSIYSFLYQGGGNIGECMAFGRIAGRNAAGERPWDRQERS